MVKNGAANISLFFESNSALRLLACLAEKAWFVFRIQPPACAGVVLEKASGSVMRSWRTAGSWVSVFKLEALRDLKIPYIS
jgi:hypothetical protein